MKRLSVLLLAAMLVLGAAGTARADGIDLKVRGEWDWAFGWVVNGQFSGGAHNKGKRDNDNFFAAQRLRTQIDFISSENLSGVVMFEIGKTNWGRKDEGGALDSDGKIVELKRAYLDWVVPDTKISVRMGIQGIKLPSTPMGSTLMDADIAGVVVSSPITDWLGVTAMWLRPFDAQTNDNDNLSVGGQNGKNHLDDEVDAFGLLLPITGNGWSFTPYGIYAFIGANSGIYDYLYRDMDYNNTVTVENSSTKGWWLGGHFQLDMFEPLVFNIDGVYNHISRADLGGFGHDANGAGGLKPGTQIGSQGWFIAATLDYKLDWATPGIFGWYASGDKANSDDDGMMGRLVSFASDGGGFTPTSFGFGGSFSSGISEDGYVNGTGVGTWGIGIQLADVSFIEDLSHTLRVAYYRGTNDSDLIKKNPEYQKAGGYLRLSHDVMYLTDKDSVIEVNFDHKYQLYENLTMAVELGWLHLKTDKDTWGDNGDETENAWKGQVMFKYSF
jgi:hypothetical protein